jgi:hypothetical protein
MTDGNSTSGPPRSRVSTTVTDDSDPLSSAGHFILELIRRIAAREVTQDGSLTERTKALEAQISRYKEAEQQALRCVTLLAEARHNLLERTEEAKVSHQKFVDAAALLHASNEEVSYLKTALQDKERELSELKRDTVQMMSYLRALVTMIETNRSPPNERTSETVVPSVNFH